MATSTSPRLNLKKQFCCCGTVHVVSGAAFFAWLTISIVMLLLIHDMKMDSYKLVVYGSHVIPAMFVMLATAYEEPSFMLPAILVDVFYCFVYLTSFCRVNENNEYFQEFRSVFVIEDDVDALLCVRLSFLGLIAVSMWKIAVYNRCADYLDARRKEKFSATKKFYVQECKKEANVPLYPFVV